MVKFLTPATRELGLGMGLQDDRARGWRMVLGCFWGGNGGLFGKMWLCKQLNIANLCLNWRRIKVFLQNAVDI